MARQILGLQVLVVLLVVVGAGVLAWTDARRTQVEDARTRAVAVAETVADDPLVVASTAGSPRVARASAALQPYAEQVRRDTATDFVVVMALDRTRYTHPDPARIGEAFIGDLGTAPQGRTFTQEYAGTLGPSMRAVVPVLDGGRVVALVSVGITTARIQDALLARVPSIALAALGVLAVGVAGAWLISRRLRRQTHGLGEAEITRMYEYYDAVLHAVREGLLLVDGAGRVQLVNEEARRLLDLAPDVVGRHVEDLGLAPSLARAALSADDRPDEIHLAAGTVLVVNSAPARWQGRQVGRVVTLRDRTELRAVTGELDDVRGLAESLRSQNHEAANRLHTVVSLVELGRTEEAVEFATEELAQAQQLTDRVVAGVADPVLSALLLGKSTQAAERGISLVVTEETVVRALPVDARSAVSIVGNLVDNALDAAASSERRLVEVAIRADAQTLHLLVGDSGAGVDDELVHRVFDRGWSSKPSDSPGGRGLGLALVVAAVRGAGGEVRVGRSPLGGASFEVRIGVPG